MAKQQLKTLGKSRAKFTGLETFSKPVGTSKVSCITDEVSANCPVTGQPDWYTVQIDYCPTGLCVESKTLKLYLQAFRDRGMFCEAFADKIAHDLFAALRPRFIAVTVTQKPRGGISIVSTSILPLSK